MIYIFNIGVYLGANKIIEYESDIIPRKSETIILALESGNYKQNKYKVIDIEYYTEVYKDNSATVNVNLHVAKIY